MADCPHDFVEIGDVQTENGVKKLWVCNDCGTQELR
jgi:hypothetical protein